MEYLNIIFSVLSVGLGLFGWLAPHYTLAVLDLKQGETTMGSSEVRASAGALFIGMGVGAFLIGTPTAYLMLGCCWTGAATGRLTSIAVDGFTRKKLVFFAVEAAVGIPAILLNI